MAKSKLKLIKSKPKVEKIQNPNGHLSPIPNLSLSIAEQAEAARFRALTADRAARQAMLRRIMAEIQDLDEVPSAA
jgi:hypothetical protein